MQKLDQATAPQVHHQTLAGDHRTYFLMNGLVVQLNWQLITVCVVIFPIVHIFLTYTYSTFIIYMLVYFVLRKRSLIRHF